MADSDPTPKPPKYPRPPQGGGGGGDGGMNWRGVIFIAIGMTLLALLLATQRGGLLQQSGKLAYSPDFTQALAEGRIKSAKLVIDSSVGEQRVEGNYLPAGEKTEKPYRVSVALDLSRDLLQQLRDAKVQSITVHYEHGMVASMIFNLLMFGLFGFLLFMLFRQQMRNTGRSAFNFGKIRGKMVQKDKNKIMFRDVAGVEEAKEEVQEIVDFLKDPRRFQKLGGRIPKGVLLIGPPGTGKTLLAKAIAGEADVPFFSISGSDFVEMFVGVGASRVRDLFEQGKKNAPCLIFIDEIDAVGRSRGHGVGGGNDEREQTLNALLVEMDGFDSQEGIIIIAATNRKDVLDPALLRPGRFDREVFVPLPDIRGREEILKVHARNVKVAAEADLSVVARGTPGFSGAELANLVNEAALLAAKHGRNAVVQGDFEEARDKVAWGKERRSLKRTEDEVRKTAYHEAGHALINVLLENTDPLHKVTIIPRGQALGATMMLPEADKHNYYRKRILDDLCCIMGGRVAEEMFLGDISSGASGDIRQATFYARKMVLDWGMSDKAGMVGYSDNDEYVFLGRDLTRGRQFSEATQQMLDAEVKQFIDDAHNRARDLIGSHREQLELIANALIEFETLSGEQVRELVEQGHMTNPPSKPTPPPAEPKASDDPNPRKQGERDGGFDLPGGLQPSPVGA